MSLLNAKVPRYPFPDAPRRNSSYSPPRRAALPRRSTPSCSCAGWDSNTTCSSPTAARRAPTCDSQRLGSRAHSHPRRPTGRRAVGAACWEESCLPPCFRSPPALASRLRFALVPSTLTEPLPPTLCGEPLPLPSPLSQTDIHAAILVPEVRLWVQTRRILVRTDIKRLHLAANGSNVRSVSVASPTSATMPGEGKGVTAQRASLP